MRKGAGLLLLLAVLMVTSGGCAALQKLAMAGFTDVKLTDASMQGVVTQSCVGASIVGEEDGEEVSEFLTDIQLGCVLGVSRVGVENPDYIYCAGEHEQTCRAAPLHAEFKWTGVTVASSGVWWPTRVSWER